MRQNIFEFGTRLLGRHAERFDTFSLDLNWKTKLVSITVSVGSYCTNQATSMAEIEATDQIGGEILADLMADSAYLELKETT